MSTHEIETKAQELKALQRMAEELNAEISTMQDEIKAAMGDQQEITAGAFKITWKQITSTRLDGKALKAALPDVVSRFTKTTTTRRFVVA